MANRADVEMLNQSIAGLGNSFAQRRQQQFEREQAMQRLALESQMRDIQQSRYDAQQEHFAKSEQAQADAAKKSQLNQEKMIELEQGRNTQEQNRANAQQVQAGVAQKQKLFESATVLNSTGQLSDDARNHFNDFLKKDEHFGATGLQLQAPDPRFQKNGNKDAAITNALKNAQDYRAQAQASEDPAEQKQLTGYADMLEQWANKQGKFSSEVPKPTQVKTIQRNAAGSPPTR